MKFAPIILFVYNRPFLTRRTIDYLKKNIYAKNSDLYIFCDGAKNNSDEILVNMVNQVLIDINGFKNVTIKKSIKNIGLADNIVSGLNYISKQFDRFIVLEDDIVTSKYFLYYMNKMLDSYENNMKVYHINGWSPPLNKTNKYPPIFFQRMMFCWGWASWADRWEHFDRNFERIDYFYSKKANLRNFASLDGGVAIWWQYYLNKFRFKRTWAVFWYLAIIRRQGLCLTFVKSLTDNIGNDSS